MSAHRTPISDRADVDRYEGLIRTHALRVLGHVDGELDDIRQFYRLKAWRAMGAWDPARSSQSLDRFVFGCLVNAEKDLLKRRRHREVFMEDQSARVRRLHEPRADHEEVYGDVDEGRPLIPNTLSRLELQVVVRLYRGYRKSEIAMELALGRAELTGVMRSIRSKMEDWRPESAAAPSHAAVAA